jgi:NAD(P)-dependent dehydrogenase (short-subunit alcohol dehydrogenase family)
MQGMKSALVTGGARRIGKAIALNLARQGWHVLLHYRGSADAAASTQQTIESEGGSAEILQADLGVDGAAEDLVQRALACEGELELVVNNASSFEYDTALTVTAGGLARSLAVNATAPILIARAFASGIASERQGSVVNIVDNRVVAPNPDYFSYGVAKMALMGATQMLALGLAPNVRVNAIAPGITLASGQQTADQFSAAHRINPLRRGATPEDVARAVLFAHETTSMTGAVIVIDGGQFLANPGRDVAFIDSGPA